MARERIHRRLFLSFVAIIGAFFLAALYVGPARAESVQGLLAGSLLAVVAAFLVALLLARGVGRRLDELTRAVRDLAAGEPVRAGELVRGTGDELDDLAGAVAELTRSLSGERTTQGAERERLRTVVDGMSEGV